MQTQIGRTLIAGLLAAALCFSALAQTGQENTHRPNFNTGDARKAREQAEKAARVLDSVMETPDSAIPSWVMDRAECVIVFPSVIKIAFGLGGRGGKGVATCRDPQTREWVQPVFGTLAAAVSAHRSAPRRPMSC